MKEHHSSRQCAARAAMMWIVMLAAAVSLAADNPKKEAKAEMEWGFKAARRGYWQEALMRFERADQLTPDQPRILNNIAVAQEANGLFEQALLTYQTALAIDPGNNSVRRNYDRFQEFYQTYVSPPEIEPEAEEQEEANDGAEND